MLGPLAVDRTPGTAPGVSCTVPVPVRCPRLCCAVLVEGLSGLWFLPLLDSVGCEHLHRKRRLADDFDSAGGGEGSRAKQSCCALTCTVRLSTVRTASQRRSV